MAECDLDVGCALFCILLVVVSLDGILWGRDAHLELDKIFGFVDCETVLPV